MRGDGHDDTTTAPFDRYWLHTRAGVRPLWGATLLALGHLVLLSTAVWTDPIGPVSGFGAAMVLSPIAGIVCAILAVARAGDSTVEGVVGIILGFGAAAAAFAASAGLYSVELTAVGLLAVGVGGLACTSQQSVRLRVGPILRVGQVFIIVAIVSVLALNAPAAEAEGVPFPTQSDDLGGFVVYQSDLFSPRYDFAPACPSASASPGDEGGFLDPGEDPDYSGDSDTCIGNGNVGAGEYSLDSTEFASGEIDTDTPAEYDGVTYGINDEYFPYADYAAYIQLNNESGTKVELGGDQNSVTDFLVYKNFESSDGPFYASIAGDYARASSPQEPSDQTEGIPEAFSAGGPDGEDNGDRNAIGAHIHEFRSTCQPINSRIELLGGELENDGISSWDAAPGTTPGDSNRINDVRTASVSLGLVTRDARPQLTSNGNTRDISLVAWQLGSTQTTIYDFNLSVIPGERSDLTFSEPPNSPSDDTQADCPSPSPFF